MKRDLSQKAIIYPIIIILLLLLFITIPYITNTNSDFYQYWKILRSALILITAWLTMKFITVIFIEPINKSRKKPLTNIVKDIIITFIYLTAVSVIITVVYGQTILSIWAFCQFLGHYWIRCKRYYR